MNPSPQDIIEFQKLWKEQTGQDIDPATAHDHATKLLRFMEIMSGNQYPPSDEPP